jgi:hypothetical protein
MSSFIPRGNIHEGGKSIARRVDHIHGTSLIVSDRAMLFPVEMPEQCARHFMNCARFDGAEELELMERKSWSG